MDLGLLLDPSISLELLLQGLVRGIGATDLNAGELVGDSTWYRNPLLLGGVALGLSVALYIPFW